MTALQFVLETSTPNGPRAGIMKLTHGEVLTPVFMPVGTAGTVKALTPRDLRRAGAQICLGNTYHLYLRPTTDVIHLHGGLHNMMGWGHPILTDSGGYQVFSLESLRKITEEGVQFRSHIDGSSHMFTAESVMGIQETIGSDIAMVFDECPDAKADRAYVERSMERTTRWAQRCINSRTRSDQAVFGIVQGALFEDLRAQHARALSAMEFEGLAIGGLSVGESTEEMYAMVRFVTQHLPRDRPRYLMGVGKPEDMLWAVAHGVDMFDCVLPTRNARNGMLFTDDGELTIKQAQYRMDLAPVSRECSCYTCSHFTRAYLRHLYMAKEILYSHLATLHNVHYYVNLLKRTRAAIVSGGFQEFVEEILVRRAAGNNRKSC
ncbi:MAG: tRNA guanosine(34) transglycosylase Tgt [Myxococcales bacterium]|nr:tRNA guanosine(34) transglycosylase Tgt [Myxococcales bacterium]